MAPAIASSTTPVTSASTSGFLPFPISRTEKRISVTPPTGRPHHPDHGMPVEGSLAVACVIRVFTSGESSTAFTRKPPTSVAPGCANRQSWLAEQELEQRLRTR